MKNSVFLSFAPEADAAAAVTAQRSVSDARRRADALERSAVALFVAFFMAALASLVVIADANAAPNAAASLCFACFFSIAAAVCAAFALRPEDGCYSAETCENVCYAAERRERFNAEKARLVAASGYCGAVALISALLAFLLCHVNW